VDFGHAKILEAIFPGQSLLLVTMLNDKITAKFYIQSAGDANLSLQIVWEE